MILFACCAAGAALLLAVLDEGNIIIRIRLEFRHFPSCRLTIFLVFFCCYLFLLFLRNRMMRKKKRKGYKGEPCQKLAGLGLNFVILMGVSGGVWSF